MNDKFDNKETKRIFKKLLENSHNKIIEIANKLEKEKRKNIQALLFNELSSWIKTNKHNREMLKELTKIIK